jgi:UDP-4-amino-4,6-dideoxy-N-acetyl-beta-L-altrosamine N-acetyltransferase
MRLREVRISDAAQILKWRTSAGVTDFMATDIDGDLGSQETWIRNSYLKHNYYHWIIVIDEQDVGLLSISELDLQSRTVSWGYYVAEPGFVGLGFMVPPFLYNFLFTKLQIKKISVEVFENNYNVVAMHLLHGYVRESNLDRIIEKNGVQHNLFALSLASQDWSSKKAFQNSIVNFPMDLWIASPFDC